MESTPHIPALRLGRPYESLDTVEVRAVDNGQVLARMSKVNAGIIRRDAKRLPEARAAMRRLTTSQWLDVCRKAGELFTNATLPLGNTPQSPGDYMESLSRTSGLPHTLVRANMAKLADVMAHMGTILRGLTRGLPPEVLDHGVGEQDGVPVSYVAASSALGVVLPSNSPGVHSLWLPAVALKMPVVLKPGSEEPWTPARLCQALLAAGCPPEGLCFYPADHDGAAAVLESCGRAMIFGGQDTVERYAANPAVEVHGPGWSKVVLGEDVVDHWRDYLDVLVTSIAANSGRSCINASAILVPRHSREIAQALAQRLARIQPLPRDHPDAELSGFANPGMARWIDAQIEEGLAIPGATDLTRACRGDASRLVEVEGITYLRPTIVHSDAWSHPLAHREFMFPCASVVEMPVDQMPDALGPSLVVTAITRDPALTQRLLASPLIQRLNLGPIATTVVRWDQPHEGNLFEFLYRRRAIQSVEAWADRQPSSTPAGQ